MSKKIVFIFIVLSLLFITNQVEAQQKISSKYLIRTFIDENGDSIDEIIVPGRPPKDFRAPISEPTDATVILTDVPAFDWSFGCSATSAAMIAGHYDNTIFPEMYTGPTNGGIMPMTNSTWGSVNINGENRKQCPLSATRHGVDGRAINGHVDNYWYAYGHSGDDPIGSTWPGHTHSDCTADFMGTNQDHWSNSDGSTTFYNNTNGSPLYDFSACEGYTPPRKDGCHGLRQFFESRGYSIQSNGNYSQYIYGYNGNTIGFTYNQFKAEIDAGRPVLIQVAGHTMLGYGYDDSSNIVYLHDTWDYSNHTMTWGGTYPHSSGPMQHYGVGVFILEDPSITVTVPNGGEVWNLGTSHNITWTSQYVNTLDIDLYNSGSYVMTIVGSVTASLGSFSWPIPGGLTPAATYSIRISDSDASANYDDSNAYFTLQASSITIQTPNGGEVWEIGTQQIINWISTNTGPNVNIELYSGGSFYSTIISSTPDTGNYPWDISTSTVAGTQYTVKIEDVTTPATNDFSDNPFTLTNPPGYGQGSNSGDPTQPIIVDVEQILIDGQLVDPDTDVDPEGNVALSVTIQTYADAQNTISYPDEVGISYDVGITGDFSSSSEICFTLYNLDLLLNYPNGVYWWDGSTWVTIPSANWGVSNQVSFCIPMVNRSGSTEIVLDKGGDSPLPVTLTDFSTAIIMNEFVQISWTTQTEVSINTWNLYRAIDNSTDHTLIYSEAGTNTTQPHTYIFEDHEVTEYVVYNYYLEAIGYDGTSNMWGPISAMIDGSSTPQLPETSLLRSNYPNPFNPSTTIMCDIKDGEEGILTIYNSKGQVIERQTLNAGEHILKWDGTAYGSGVYLYKLETESYTETKKMIMVK